MNDSAIQIVDTEKQMVDALKTHMNVILRIRNEVFVENVDYGIIPGTGTKPVLLLPGMEKLIRTLHLRPVYVPATTIEDFDKPLFMYRYECRLFDIETDKLVATAIGSANSKETKWAYRTANRICPNCGADVIIKGKAEYGGGWLCFAKKGGCGAKFQDGDQTIESQATGRVENPDIFDQINTIDKIAQKRSLSSSIKLVAGVSEYFAVDLDDMSPHVITPDSDNVITIEEPPTIRDAPKSSQKPPKSAFSKKQVASTVDTENGAKIESGENGHEDNGGLFDMTKIEAFYEWAGNKLEVTSADISTAMMGVFKRPLGEIMPTLTKTQVIGAIIAWMCEYDADMVTRSYGSWPQPIIDAATEYALIAKVTNAPEIGF